MKKQIHIKVGSELYEQIKLFSEQERVSMQDFIVSSVTRQVQRLRQPSLPKRTFTFIDLFAGIGGMRLGFEAAGGRCVFTSEWDKYSQQTYQANFGEMPEGDITRIREQDIPDHDVLVAGFPCQPFSIAGVSKKNSLGKKHGFLDETQGTLFFDVARIIGEKYPKAFLLENVKNLRSHDRGKTFRVICDTLDQLGYNVEAQIIDGKHFVPQHRERIFIVGLRRDIYGEEARFQFPEIAPTTHRIRDILEEDVQARYTLSDKLWQYLQDYAEKHRSKGNGFGYGLVDLNGIARTLSARYYKDGSEILIPQENKNPRRLTPRECARLQGFPESYKIVVSDTQAYKQFGNSVVVPVVETIARRMISTMKELQAKENMELLSCN